MTYDDALRRITELKRGINDPFSITECSEIETLYYAVLGRRVRTCNCKDKWHDAITEMLYYLKKNGKMKEKSKYVLRAGVIIQPADGNVYTNENLTDKIAAKFLAERPNARGLFEIIPESTDEPSTDEADAIAADERQQRIAELEAENEALKTKIAEMESPATDEPSEVVDDVPAESPNVAKGDEELSLNENIVSAITERLASGKSKTAIKSELSGTEIDGIKLTNRLVAEYIKAIEGKIA